MNSFGQYVAPAKWYPGPAATANSINTAPGSIIAPSRTVTVPQGGSWKVPGGMYECQERRRADIIRGAKERIWWTYYDSEKIDQADAATASQYLFRVPIGGVSGAFTKTKIWTNMTTSGVLPSPQEFIVHYVACYVFPYIISPVTLTDLALVANNLVMTFTVNQKTYYETLSWDMPSGGGQRMYSPAASLTAAPDFLFNGDANQLGIKRLRVPVFILENQSFNWHIEMDPAAFAALTEDAVIWFYVLMHGELYRQIT